MKKIKTNKGPFCYENWKRFLLGEPWQEAYEYPLFGDNDNITGDLIEGLGPYEVINNVVMQSDRPILTLRITQYIPYKSPDMEKTQAEHYHGGTEAEEIAALISLCLGIRVKSGAYNRIFSNPGDPRGRPVGHGFSTDPYLITPKHKKSRLILRSALLQTSLDEAKLIATLPNLSVDDANILVRTARMYQEGLWIVESTPELTWLMLVSAIETVAHRWKKSKPNLNPVEKMREFKPDSEEILRKHARDKGDALVHEVAKEIKDNIGIGATKTFVGFIDEYLPPPPLLRPPLFAQIEWDKDYIKGIVNKIYGYRSEALHQGRPFPAPMCYPPFYVDEYGVPEEKTTGLATGMKGAVWEAKNTPIHLHMFEYIVRSVILNWWKSLIVTDTKAV